MAFHDRAFDAYVIVAGPRSAPPWNASEWKRLASVLDPILQRAEQPVAVRTSQLAGEPGKMKQLRFGRLGWNATAHAKWTHAARDARLFESVEVWAPSWTRCMARDLAPDVYASIANPAAAAAPHVPPVVLLAIACDLHLDAASAARAMADVLGSNLRAHRRASWGTTVPGGSDGFVDGLQDVLPFGAFTSSWTSGVAPSFKEPWSAC